MSDNSQAAREIYNKVEILHEQYIEENSTEHSFGQPGTARNRALADYQQQLMLLEQENKRRLLNARQERDALVEREKIKEEENQRQKEADELSRTAGQLLDSLSHEQNQKFKESSFMALMRQLRDKEVSVEGDKIVDVSTLLSSLIV